MYTQFVPPVLFARPFRPSLSPVPFARPFRPSFLRVPFALAPVQCTLRSFVYLPASVHHLCPVFIPPVPFPSPFILVPSTYFFPYIPSQTRVPPMVPLLPPFSLSSVLPLCPFPLLSTLTCPSVDPLLCFFFIYKR